MKYSTSVLVLIEAMIGLIAPPACATEPIEQAAQAAQPVPTVPTVAFYYGPDLPAASLAQYDRVVVQPDQAESEAVADLRSRGSTVFAYVSLSELSRTEAVSLEKSWRLGQNTSWNTVIMDAAQPGWRQTLLERYCQPLWDRGFRAFFLDNLDSYLRVVSTPEERAAQANGLAQIIKDLHGRFPGVELMLNRGFELLSDVAPLAVGIVAESLYRGYDPDKKDYVEVSEQDRIWLLQKLRAARDLYRLHVAVVDYVPPEQRELARTTARQIAELGIMPWVTDSTLTTLGVGAVEVIPRSILALYNGAEQRASGLPSDLAYSAIHRMAAFVFEYFGFTVDYLDVDGPLPAGSLRGKYAGIVTWFEDSRVPNANVYGAWLLKQIDAGVRVAVLGSPGFFPNTQLLRRLDISLELREARGGVHLVEADQAATGLEAQVRARRAPFFPLQLRERAGRHLLSVEDESGARMDAVFIAWWGGMAVNPYLLAAGPKGTSRWSINPFFFFKQALHLPDIPAPDVTTVNGRRLLIMHVDGDGFPDRAEMPGNDYSAKVILEQILKRYPVKATVSVIEGEVGPTGRCPQSSPELEAVARDIFALPNVEAASHSYSHPGNWLRGGRDQQDGSVSGLLRYDFSLRRELDGSIAYINERLAPRGRPAKVILWPGGVIPTEALAQAQSARLLNMNGGNTLISQRLPTLTAVSPMGRPSGRYYQVYAPIQSEESFTNLWRGPYFGYREVISTFKLTDSPRRLKPISIYFHFYSGSKLGSLKALKQVLGWSLAQQVNPIYASEYIGKVEDFQHLSLALRLDGCWQLRGDGRLTTLRLNPAQGRVDTLRSQGVIAVHDLPQGRYISLDASGRAVICIRPVGTPNAATAG